MQDRIDRLIADGLPEFIFVAPDCYNALGGSQYLNGAAGRYQDHLVDELIPALKRELRTTIDERGVAVTGKSSGGFGAFHLALRDPKLFVAIADHSGDAGFDHSVWPAVAQTIGVLDKHPGDEDAAIASFLDYFRRAANPSYDEGHALMTLACAAAYSPDDDAPHGFRLPFDIRSGRRRDDVWERWLAIDPVNAAPQQAEALNALKLFFFDCGNRDQYGIHLGCRQLHENLEAAGIRHEYEEFDGTHSGTSHRYDVSFPKLLRALGEDWSRP